MRVEQECLLFAEQAKKFKDEPKPLEHIYEMLANEGITETDREELVNILGSGIVATLTESLSKTQKGELSADESVARIAGRVQASLLHAFVAGYRIGRSSS